MTREEFDREMRINDTVIDVCLMVLFVILLWPVAIALLTGWILYGLFCALRSVDWPFWWAFVCLAIAVAVLWFHDEIYFWHVGDV